MGETKRVVPNGIIFRRYAQGLLCMLVLLAVFISCLSIQTAYELYATEFFPSELISLGCFAGMSVWLTWLLITRSRHFALPENAQQDVIRLSGHISEFTVFVLFLTLFTVPVANMLAEVIAGGFAMALLAVDLEFVRVRQGDSFFVAWSRQFGFDLLLFAIALRCWQALLRRYASTGTTPSTQSANPEVTNA
ncbi:MAG: hypothetical protein AMXMBFR84_02660 [Candidatus Hydrogenedentota bacterium]